MVGGDVLVTPVLTPNVSSVSGEALGAAPLPPTNPSTYILHETGFLPGRGQVIWRDWYTHEVVSSMLTGESMVDLDAPLGHIPVLVRSGAALLLHSQPGYTTRASAKTPYALLVSLSNDSHAYGTAIIDDGETLVANDDDDAHAGAVTQKRNLVFHVRDKHLDIRGEGAFDVAQPLGVITVLGVYRRPRRVRLNGVDIPFQKWVYTSVVHRLLVSDLSIDLNERSAVTWE
jgi:alpha-glucosidase